MARVLQYGGEGVVWNHARKMTPAADAAYRKTLAYNQRWRRERKAAGLCWICGASRTGSKSTATCVECFKKERERVRLAAEELRQRRLRAGLCVTCGKERIHPDLSRVCLLCAVRERERKRKIRGATRRVRATKTYRLQAEAIG